MTWGRQNTEAEAHAQLSYAIEERGVNFLDTAEMYPVPATEDTQGSTDRFIGSWLKSSPGRRAKVVIASKVAGFSERLVWLREKRETTRVVRRQIRESVDKSLQRLGVAELDLLQVHWPDRYVALWASGSYDAAQERESEPFGEQLAALTELVKEGKVRALGLSNETSFGVMSFHAASVAAGLPHMATIQNNYSMLSRSAFETDLAEVCSPRHCNVSLLPYSPLAGGALSAKYLAGDAPPGSRLSLFPGFMDRYNKKRAREAIAEYAAVAAKHGLSPAVLALAWVKTRPFVGSTIIGATSVAQLKENIDAFDVQLSPDALADVAAVYKRFRDPAIE